ncbi:hypothetical protein LINPERPRIM_LOCUS9711 [Linum perenne]
MIFGCSAVRPNRRYLVSSVFNVGSFRVTSFWPMLGS